jgi:hypothetical protein
LRQQLRQLDAQTQQHVNVSALTQGIETFCKRLQPTLDNLMASEVRIRYASSPKCPLLSW